MSGWKEKFPAKLLGYIPVTVTLLVVVSWLFQVSDVNYREIYPSASRKILFDPFYHSTNMFPHLDRTHFESNMRLLAPFGVLLTWLTSNRHVAVVVVFAQLASNVVSGVAGQLVFGASSVALAVIAATLVRATGYVMQNRQPQTTQTVVGAVVSAGAAILFMIFLVSGESDGPPISTTSSASRSAER